MEIDYNEKNWEQKACPKYDCRKDSCSKCKCGLQRVFIPTALGDDSDDSPVAPKNGAYCNAIVVYEANGNTYIYSKDGVPTLVKEKPEDIHIDERAFKPFPASVNTTGTTQQFLNSILALHAETGMAYLGTVSLSDMPAGIVQEEVEVYVYSDNVVYAVMRSTDVAPYQWWCASYNYGGWRPVGGGSSELVCYVDKSKFFGNPGITTIFYHNEDLTNPVTIQEFYDAATDGGIRVVAKLAPSETNESFRNILTPIEVIYPHVLNSTTMTNAGMELDFFSASEDSIISFSSHQAPTGHEFYNGPLEPR